MIRLLFCATLVFLVNSCSSEVTIEDIHVSDKPLNEAQEKKPKSEPEKVPEKTTEASSKFRTALLYEPKTGWGYDIFEGTKLVIHQPTIPAIQGIRGFKNEADAQKVADAVAKKLDLGIMPPSLTIEEMKALGVL